MEEKVTIFDVAREAGVSKGTVDRVLHNRGEVSAQSAEKVRRAIEKLNFQPNLYAALLASKKAKVIACLLPSFKPGGFWGKMHEGIMHGAALKSGMNIHIQPYFYDEYSADDFNKVAKEVLQLEPDGVIMPTLFKEAVSAFAQKLAEQGIPYLYLDTKVEDDDNYLAFVGMPRHDSGILCAALLTERMTRDEVGSILIVDIKRDDGGMSDPSLKRREGFVNFIQANFPDTVLQNVYISPTDGDAIRDEMNKYFSEHRDTKYIITFNSRLYLIAQSLAEHPTPGRMVIGFDALEQNLDMLREGLAGVIIAQHIDVQATKAVEILSDYILTLKMPENKNNYTHIDILTKYNIDHY